MRQFEDRLRAELQGVKAVTISKETMLARVARARRRRSVAAGVGMVAASVLALLLIVPALHRGGPADTTGTVPRLIHEGQLINVVFTDATHGYALQQRCSMLNPHDIVNPNPRETPDVQRTCEAKLFATADAGVTWQERTAPAEPAHKDAGVRLVPGHSMMLWVPSPGTLALGTWDRRYWTTIDGGVTWTESPSPYSLGAPGSYGVLGPGDRHVFLASPPPGGPESVGDKYPIVGATDGSFWGACPKGPCLRVTRDQGQSWQNVPLPRDGVYADFVATVDGRTVYTSVSDNDGRSAFLRSTDGGSTWQAVPEVITPFRIAYGIALPNGDLIVLRSSMDNGLFRLAAGSTTLQEMVGRPTYADSLYLTEGWLVAATAWRERDTPDLGTFAYVSPDNGVTWIAVPQP